MIDLKYIRNENFLYRFFNEMFLYTGHYALFYIFMELSSQGINILSNVGHVILILALLFQTTILCIFKNNFKVRIFASFISPLIYTLIELREGLQWILNIGHLFFWIFTFVLILLQFISYKFKYDYVKFTTEFLITFTNINIFIFIYFYFDLKLSYLKLLQTDKVSLETYQQMLSVSNLYNGFQHFLQDPAHIYVIFAGFFLSITLSYSRIKIVFLTNKLNTLLGEYIGKETRDKLVSSKQSIQSSKENITLLYSDIRNFTGMSEKYPAKDVVETLNQYYSLWDSVITKANGSINKFVGDAVLAIFETPQNITAVVNCSINILEKLPALNDDLKTNNLPMIEDIGIAIHYGEVILGNIGSQRKDYTVIGDNVNIVARIESLCKEYKKQLLISEVCYKKLEPDVQIKFLNIGDVLLKGKEKKISLYAYEGKKS